MDTKGDDNVATVPSSTYFDLPLAGRTWKGFDALAPELRNRIYHLALGGRVLHMAINPGVEAVCYIGEKDASETCREGCGKYYTPRCNETIIDPFTRDIRPSSTEYHDQWPSYRTRHRACFDANPPSKRPTLSLMRVSRSIYEEARQVFYGSNELHFLYLEDLYEFLTHRRRDQLELMRSVTLRLSTQSLAHNCLESLRPYFEDQLLRENFIYLFSKLSKLDTFRILWEVDGSDEYTFPTEFVVDYQDNDDPNPSFPDLETARLLGEISDSVNCRKKAHVYPAQDRFPGWYWMEQTHGPYDSTRFWQLEKLAVGASGYVSGEDGHEG